MWTLVRQVSLAALLIALLCPAAPARAFVATPTSASAPPACGRGPVAAQPRGTSGFSLQTGPYLLTFADGRMVIAHPGSPGGLRLALLPGGSALDLLPHVAMRRISAVAGTIVIILTIQAPWTRGTITLHAYPSCPGLLRWTVRLAVTGTPPDAPQTLGTDLTYSDAHGARTATPPTTLYTGAAPSATALTYLYDPDLASTLFYLADLTALNPLFNATGDSAANGPFRDPRGGPGGLVGAAGNGLGTVLPQGVPGILQPGQGALTLIDSYLLLTIGRPTSEVDTARRFLDGLGALYALIHRPDLAMPDWARIGAHTAHDLAGPDVTVQLGGHPYLRAYVSDRRNAPELITQLNVLAGDVAYERTFGPNTDTTRLRTTLLAGLPAFYAPEYGSVVNNLPLPHGAGGSTESWYYIGDLVNLARLATVDAGARTLLLRSIPAAISLAHHVHYLFPRAVSYQGWRGGGGLQADVAGAYAYLMLQLYQLTHDRRYIAEAEAGIAHLSGYGFHLAYETHTTALAATAAALLYRLTGRQRYLDLSLLPLANLFTATWLWDCRYGTCANGYHTFFGLSPLPWAGYIAMMEQAEAYRAFHEYALLVGNDAPPAVRTLVAEFCRYSLSTLAYALPPLLPKGVASPSPAEYSFVPRNRLELYIPLEDLRDGGQPSGQIGQEIYGAGGPLALAGLSSVRLAPDLWLATPYPLSVAPIVHGFGITLTGTAGYTIQGTFSGPGTHRVAAVTTTSGHPIPLHRCGTALCLALRGGTDYRLQLR